MEKENKKEQKKSLFTKVLIGLGIGASVAVAIVCALKARKAIKEKEELEELADLMYQNSNGLYSDSPHISFKFNQEAKKLEYAMNRAFKNMLASDFINDILKYSGDGETEHSL